MKKDIVRYTLIELLVVLSVIVILGSMLISVLANVKRETEVLTCKNNMSNCYKIFLVNASDNRGFLPEYNVSYSQSRAIWQDKNQRLDNFHALIDPYFNEYKETLYCPVKGSERWVGRYKQKWGKSRQDYFLQFLGGSSWDNRTWFKLNIATSDPDRSVIRDTATGKTTGNAWANNHYDSSIDLSDTQNIIYMDGSANTLEQPDIGTWWGLAKAEY